VSAPISCYTGPTAENLDAIPAALKARPQWVLWQAGDRVDKQTGTITGLEKIPINPQTLRHASTTDPATWGTFDACVAALPLALEEWETDDPATYRGGGIGYVFCADDPYVGIDLDHCVDPTPGVIADWAQTHRDALDSYTEITPSGTGLHILVQGAVPDKGHKKGAIEIYREARFFTVTGWHLPESPPTIEPRQASLSALWCATFGPYVGETVWTLDSHGVITNHDGKPWVITQIALAPSGEPYAFFAEASGGHPLIQCGVAPAPQPVQGGSATLADDALLQQASTAKNGAKFAALWAGDSTGYPSPSEADLALCMLLAFWTQDPDQLDRLFRQSGLMRPKWSAPRGDETYGARTIGEALARQTAHYTPAHGAQLVVQGAVQQAQHGQNGYVWGSASPDTFACPELPTSAKVPEAFAAGASIFLDDYIAFSKQWAPRAYEGFYEAAALFTLSTTAARRVKIEFGPHGVYPSLYMALAARTSLFTKTTAVDIALELLRRAGLYHLLADDDATPQAFLRSLTLHIPTDYAELPPEAQHALKERLAFAGQKGWFYEEWGQHLHAMMQKEGQMAAFRSILRRLDDHRDEYVYSTISRGRDVLVKPYVALLVNVTPADLKPFMRAQSPLWRDGYIARFAFIAPGDAEASTAAFPEGTMTIPRPLITTLASWHKRLGIPRIALDPITDAKGKPTGRYRPVFTSPHKETTYALSPEVRKAFYAYDEALHVLMAQSKNEDLDGCYARFPMKALRIAGLLASLHDDSSRYTIWPAQWYHAQQIAERWRHDLHRLIKQVHGDAPPSQESRKEQRVLEVLRSHGALSMRDLHLKTKLTYSDIEHILTTLVTAGVACEEITARTKKYKYIVH
jgi:putative DNA primase/helicase